MAMENDYKKTWPWNLSPKKKLEFVQTLHPQLRRLDAWQHLVCLRRACCNVAGNFANWKGCGAMAMIGHGMLWHDMPYYGMLWHVGNSQNCPPFVYLPHIHCLIWLHIVSGLTSIFKMTRNWKFVADRMSKIHMASTLAQLQAFSEYSIDSRSSVGPFLLPSTQTSQLLPQNKRSCWNDTAIHMPFVLQSDILFFSEFSDPAQNLHIWHWRGWVCVMFLDGLLISHVYLL